MINASIKTGRIVLILAGFLVFLAIGMLGFNAARDIRLLGSASSDNVQWTLSQSEVEFLEFTHQTLTQPVDLDELRRKYDVFYSRIQTLDGASVFAELREHRVFVEELAAIQTFLERSVPVIDAADAELLAKLPELRAMSEEIRMTVRALSNSGLDLFAREADLQRRRLAGTMSQLAIALAVLIGALVLAVIYLNRLNKGVTLRERQLELFARRLNTVIRTSPNGVLVSDATGHILELSPTAEAIFGYRFEDVVGKDFGALIVPESLREAHYLGMERVRNGGERRVTGKGPLTMEARRADGSVFPIELTVESAKSEDGDLYIAFVRDISKRLADEAELVAARDKALASEKLKTDFMATMSHEIRTPLNGLLGNLNLLRETSLDTAQQRYVQNMDSSGRLLMRHISDVLDITRYDAGKLDTKSEPMNVSSLLQDIVDSQSGMALANGTRLGWVWVGAPVTWVNSDHDRVQHVLMNLIGNAVKFTKQGSVLLTARGHKVANQCQLSFEVRDTGPGMSEELAERIFDDFVTGNAAYDREVGGTGLGLSIAKRFVSALGGEIGVRSKEGKGSTFWVTIPVTMAQRPDEPEPSATVEPALPPMNVLVVEDNEINRAVAREMLEADGHQVTLASDGLMGVICASSAKFDLILMDIAMPHMDGCTATREIRNGQGLSRETPIVALTANAMLDEQKRFFEDGMNAILTKPLTKATLRATLHGHQPKDLPIIEYLIDHAHNFEAREALGDEGYAMLFERFVSEVDALVAELSGAVREGLAARSHSNAGSAAVFGAVNLRDHLKAIENAARSGDSALDQLIKDLPALWAATKTTLA